MASPPDAARHLTEPSAQEIVSTRPPTIPPLFTPVPLISTATLCGTAAALSASLISCVHFAAMFAGSSELAMLAVSDSATCTGRLCPTAMRIERFVSVTARSMSVSTLAAAEGRMRAAIETPAAFAGGLTTSAVTKVLMPLSRVFT